MKRKSYKCRWFAEASPLTEPSYGCMVDSEILGDVTAALAISKTDRADFCWRGVSFGLRPIRLPASMADRRPHQALRFERAGNHYDAGDVASGPIEGFD